MVIGRSMTKSGRLHAHVFRLNMERRRPSVESLDVRLHP